MTIIRTVVLLDNKSLIRFRMQGQRTNNMDHFWTEINHLHVLLVLKLIKEDYISLSSSGALNVVYAGSVRCSNCGLKMKLALTAGGDNKTLP